MCDVIELLKIQNSKNEEKLELLLTEFFENRIDNALEVTLKENRRYQDSCKEICEKIDKIKKNEFTQEQWRDIDRALCASSMRGAEYGKVAYSQGFKDAINLLSELNQLLY